MSHKRRSSNVVAGTRQDPDEDKDNNDEDVTMENRHNGHIPGRNHNHRHHHSHSGSNSNNHRLLGGNGGLSEDEDEDDNDDVHNHEGDEEDDGEDEEEDAEDGEEEDGDGDGDGDEEDEEDEEGGGVVVGISVPSSSHSPSHSHSHSQSQSQSQSRSLSPSTLALALASSSSSSRLPASVSSPLASAPGSAVSPRPSSSHEDDSILLFASTFSGPSSLYKILAIRSLSHQIFLRRNLSYVPRNLRPLQPDGAKRAGKLHVDDLLALKEKDLILQQKRYCTVLFSFSRKQHITLLSLRSPARSVLLEIRGIMTAKYSGSSLLTRESSLCEVSLVSVGETVGLSSSPPLSLRGPFPQPWLYFPPIRVRLSSERRQSQFQ